MKEAGFTNYMQVGAYEEMLRGNELPDGDEVSEPMDPKKRDEIIRAALIRAGLVVA